MANIYSSFTQILIITISTILLQTHSIQQKIITFSKNEQSKLKSLSFIFFTKYARI